MTILFYLKLDIVDRKKILMINNCFVTIPVLSNNQMKGFFMIALIELQKSNFDVNISNLLAAGTLAEYH